MIGRKITDQTITCKVIKPLNIIKTNNNKLDNIINEDEQFLTHNFNKNYQKVYLN